MPNLDKLSTEELSHMDNSALISIIINLQEQLKVANDRLAYITEQIAIMNQRKYGRKTEKVNPNQLTLFDFEEFAKFNEAESLSDESKEPAYEEVVVSSYVKRRKTTREDKLEGIPNLR